MLYISIRKHFQAFGQFFILPKGNKDNVLFFVFVFLNFWQTVDPQIFPKVSLHSLRFSVIFEQCFYLCNSLVSGSKAVILNIGLKFFSTNVFSVKPGLQHRMQLFGTT